jgi:hypothetical protein
MKSKLTLEREAREASLTLEQKVELIKSKKERLAMVQEQQTVETRGARLRKTRLADWRN